MRIYIIACLLCGFTCYSQEPCEESICFLPLFSSSVETPAPIIDQTKWKLNSDRLISGGLVFLAGASKGFNETLVFHWKGFRNRFPDANPNWFNPAISWKNKYKNNDPTQGPRFPLSTSVLVAFTDQYHLNTLINRMAWTSALIIRIGDRKQKFGNYLRDLIYYTACHQAGFALSYYPFHKRRKN